METNGSYDPVAALQDAQRARDQVASRATAPGYYYPVLGLALGLLVAAEAVGGPLAFVATMVCAVTSGLLIGKYRESTGLWVTYGTAGRRARPVWLGYAVALLVLLGIAVWVQMTGRSPWWGLPLGLLSFAGTIAVGKVMEPRLRHEIRTGATTPSRTR